MSSQPIHYLEDPSRFVGVMYTAYGDESTDETRQRVFAIAGLFGNEGDWNKFKPKWLERTGGKTFHATDCDTDNGYYKPIPHAVNKKLYADLANLIADSNLQGLGAAVSVPDYNELLAPLLDAHPYYICFHAVVMGLASHSNICTPRDRIQFKFDRNREIEYNAGQLYDRVRQLSDPQFEELMSDEIAFVTREDVGIQAADLVAREAMKHLDNQCGPIKRDTRKSTLALEEHKRIIFRSYTREWCERIIHCANELSASHPPQETNYFDWILHHRLNDTLATKLRYERWYRTTVTKDILPKTH